MPDVASELAMPKRMLRRFETLNRKLAPIFLVAGLVGAMTGFAAAALLAGAGVVAHLRLSLAAKAEAAFGGGLAVSMAGSALLALAEGDFSTPAALRAARTLTRQWLDHCLGEPPLATRALMVQLAELGARASPPPGEGEQQR